MRATVSMPDLFLPIDAQGHLRFDAPSGRTLDFDADGDVLTLNVPTWVELTGLSPRPWSARVTAIRHLSGLLSTYALTLRLSTQGRVFLELGANVRPNWLARIAGLGRVRLSSPVIGLFFRR